MQFDVDIENKIVDVPDLGATLRRIFSAADTAAKTLPKYHRKWKVRYKDVIIGEFQLASANKL